MSGDTDHDDPEASDGNSEVEYSDHDEHDPDIIKDDDDSTDMAEHKFQPERDENGKLVGAAATKPKYDPKDPLRPRRKKARRACFACQRAHLTCGDERPCQRCIKRGLADACQDGVRKKAKYLHDAPPEALRPVLGPNYSQGSNGRANSGLHATSATTSDTSPTLDGFFPQVESSPTYPMFASNPMPPPVQSRLSYTGQHSPMSPNTFQDPNRQSSMQNLSMPQVSNDVQSSFGGALFDPSNPAIFNFDLEGLNFGNHYGALEFGMLGHIASGSAETPPRDHNSSISSQGLGDVNFNNGNLFGNNMGQYGQMYGQDMMGFGGMQNNNMHPVHHGLPHAYAIATGPASHHSPSTDASPGASGTLASSPIVASFTPPQQSTGVYRPPKQQHQKGASGKFGPSSVLGKRNRDPSSIYDTVHEPYSYTTGFHSLTAFLQRRFSASKTLRIAKSLASIRPSFISCTKTLNRQDLIFMEKCFQRTLFEYEEFMHHCCTPTLVCRRTGEIAAVNKEFTLLTGWKKEVLLGQEPNLNVNTGKSAQDSGPSSGLNTGRAGLATPRMRPLSLSEQQSKEARPQHVFLAELLDDDSVVEFYEDFARLAFNDSRGSVTKRCKLLSYQTKEGDAISPEQKDEMLKKHNRVPPGGIGGMGNRVTHIDGEHGIGNLTRDGKMDCSYCWTAKRDVFDIPMLIVMNFLPCI